MVRAEAREQHRRREDLRPAARPGRMARKGASAPIARMRELLTAASFVAKHRRPFLPEGVGGPA